jgi:putative transposase
MTRPLRIEFPDAIYHVTSRGNLRADIVRDDADRRSWCAGLENVARRRRWAVLSYVLMNNHFHLFVRTPDGDLSRGMQEFLSSYASRFSRRRGMPGHVFQGRYSAKLVGDSSYYWTVARYVVLNPVRAGLTSRPEDWQWSSYADLVHSRPRLEWIAHGELLRAWEGNFGGADAKQAFCAFVECADARALPSPFVDAFDGWVLGSAEYVERIRCLVRAAPPDREAAGDRELRRFTLDELRAAVQAHCGEDPTPGRRGKRCLARRVFVVAARRMTTARLGDVAAVLGGVRPHSIAAMATRAALDADVQRGVEALAASLGSDLHLAAGAGLRGES